MKSILLAFEFFALIGSAQYTPAPSASGSSCSGDINTGCSQVANLSHVTNASLPNSGLANPSVTVNGTTCTLGSSCTPSGGAVLSGPCLVSGGNYYLFPSLAQVTTIASATSFTWGNQNGATMTTNGCAVVLHQDSTTTDQADIIYASAPGGNFTVYSVFRVLWGTPSAGSLNANVTAGVGPCVVNASNSFFMEVTSPGWAGILDATGTITGSLGQSGGSQSYQWPWIAASPWILEKVVYSSGTASSYVSLDDGDNWSSAINSASVTSASSGCFALRPNGAHVGAVLAGFWMTTP